MFQSAGTGKPQGKSGFYRFCQRIWKYDLDSTGQDTLIIINEKALFDSIQVKNYIYTYNIYMYVTIKPLKYYVLNIGWIMK